MAYRRIVAGSTSQLIEFMAYSSSSTTGAGLTGLTYSSMTCYYYIEGAGADVAVTPITMTLGTWASKGFVAVDGTNMPGLYQFGIPNAAIAAGATQVTFYFQATGMVPVVLVIELASVADYPANVQQLLGTAVSTPATAGILDVNIKNIANSAVSTSAAQFGVNAVQVGGNVPGSATIGTVTNLTNAPTAGDLTSTMKSSVTAAVPTVAEIQSGLATPTNITGGTITTVTNLTNAPTAGDFTSTMKTSLNAATPASVQNIHAQTGDAYAEAVTIESGIVTLEGDIAALPTNTTIQNDVLTVLNTAITTLEANPTAGSVLQYIQALKWALLNKLAITDSNGNAIGYKDDDATQAFSIAAMFTDNSTTTTRLRPL